MKPSARVWVAGLFLIAVGQAQAQTQSISFDAAWDRVKSGSYQLAAAQAATDSKVLTTQGLQNLGGPVVSLSAAAYAYNLDLNISLDPVNQGLTQISQRLPAPLQQLGLSVPPLPSSYNYKRSETGTTQSISAVWPIYTGGVTESVRAFAQAQLDEARADADKTGHELATQLVQRYFGAQLAAKAANLRQDALTDIAQHDQAMSRMLTAGLISRVERLQAQTAYEDAKRNAQKAHSDAELATVALARTVKSETPVTPSTPLFVLSQPIEPLQHFLTQALERHPGLARLSAKHAQAEQLYLGQEGLRKPQVFAFGQRELKLGHADWVGGIGVRWTLFDSVDRDALSAASNKQTEQTEHLERQARSDISLMVEKNWRAVEQTRLQFLATEPGVELAREMLRLRTAALREGTGTALELMDAEVNLVKVETERAQVAHDFDCALAKLLESSGLSDQFGAYVGRADVKVN